MVVYCVQVISDVYIPPFTHTLCPKKPDIVKIAIFSKLVIAHRQISVQYISVIQTMKLT